MNILEILSKILKNANSYFLDLIVIALLLFSGVYFTISLKFVQVRHFKEGFKKAFLNRGTGNSSFSALATAVAAQIGTGNIVGAAGAILIGGAGSVFWMWIVAFFGMATAYAEASLAQQFATVKNGEKIGGPIYYILALFKGNIGKTLSKIFAVSTILSLSFSGTMIQSNATALAAYNSYKIHPSIIGALLAILCLCVYLSGAEKIMKITGKLVPIMTVVFVFACLVVIIARANRIFDVFVLIISSAFRPKALAGGFIGATFKTCISEGVKKGLFSNEAGMGSTPHAHASAKDVTPHEQGTVAMMGVFIDTFVILTLTSFVMLSYMIDNSDVAEINQNNLMLLSLQGVLGKASSNILLNISLFLFAFTSVISWNYFGRINFEFLYDRKHIVLYFTLSAAFTFIGSIISDKLVWNISEFTLFFMILPNALALFKGRKCLKQALYRAK